MAVGVGDRRGKRLGQWGSTPVATPPRFVHGRTLAPCLHGQPSASIRGNSAAPLVTVAPGLSCPQVPAVVTFCAAGSPSPSAAPSESHGSAVALAITGFTKPAMTRSALAAV